uniref:M protein n=1 Tax=Human respiratory syncytial virus TaxID=11250 RepID=A0A6M3QZT1_HRSV|nr:truncated matrix protein [Human orthopneumovirus]
METYVNKLHEGSTYTAAVQYNVLEKDDDPASLTILAQMPSNFTISANVSLDERSKSNMLKSKKYVNYSQRSNHEDIQPHS